MIPYPSHATRARREKIPFSTPKKNLTAIVLLVIGNGYCQQTPPPQVQMVPSSHVHLWKMIYKSSLVFRTDSSARTLRGGLRPSLGGDFGRLRGARNALLLYAPPPRPPPPSSCRVPLLLGHGDDDPAVSTLCPPGIVSSSVLSVAPALFHSKGSPLLWSCLSLWCFNMRRD